MSQVLNWATDWQVNQQTSWGFLEDSRPQDSSWAHGAGSAMAVGFGLTP